MRNKPNPDSEPNIKRIDTKPGSSKQTHGFQVHFLRGKETVTKMFSDSVFGGKEQARKAARKFRKTSAAQIAPPAPRGLRAIDTAPAKKVAAKSSGKKAGAKKRSSR